MFYKKIIEILKNPHYQEISQDDILIRHFLRGQKNDTNFNDIVTHLVSDIISSDNRANKWKLLQYFDTYGQNHLGVVIQTMHELLEKDQSDELRRRIAMSIEKIDLTFEYDADLDEALFSLIEALLLVPDAMTRDFTVQALSEQRIVKAIAQNTYLFAGKQERVIKMIQSLFFQPIDEKDVEQGKPSLVLKFAGKDLSNSAFAASATFLGKLLQEPGFILSYIDVFMQITDLYLAEELFGKDDPRRIKIHGLRAIHDLDVSRDNFEYEYDPDKKLLGELKKGLLHLASLSTEQGVFVDVCKRIINQANYVGYIEIIGQVLKKHNNEEIVKKLLYDTEVLQAIEIRDILWYNIFSNYFITNPKEKDAYELFISKSGLDLNIIADICFVFPEPKSTRAQSQIDAYEKQIAEKHEIPGFKLKVEDNNKITFGSKGREPFSELTFLDDQKASQEIVDKINERRSSPRIMFDHDDSISRALVTYFEAYPEQLPEFVTLYVISEKNISKEVFDNRLLGQICNSQINVLKQTDGNQTSFYVRMIELYAMFMNDEGAKLNIARTLNENEYLRSLETKNLQAKEPRLFESLKELIIHLANDTDPSEERGDSFSLGLNSVRGIGIGLVAVLAFYYPKDEELLQVLREKSDDTIIGIQATVIENLVYLIRENYAFCQEIIDKFKTQRVTIIDDAIIRYMFRLGKEKLEGSLDLINLLAHNTDEKIQEGLGNLLGQAFCNGVDVGAMVDTMISKEFGTEKLVNSFSFQLENQIPQILIDEERKELLEKVLTVYKRLFEEYGVDKIDERLSYLYYGNDLRVNHFETLRQHELFETVVEYGSYTAQHHLNEYLLKCLKYDYAHKEYILGLLVEEVGNEDQSKYLLSDDYQSKEITEMLTYMIEKDGRNEQIDKVFDAGLKYGTSNFYEMFERFYFKG